MNELDDIALLRRYVEAKDEAAFAELVHRQVSHVYSIALGRTGGDAHLAKDVTQMVFTSLARKAPNLLELLNLGGWLCRATQFAASDIVRSERRRRVREKIAMAMHLPESDPASKTDLSRLRSELDEVIAALNEADRSAVWLCFYEKRSCIEIGNRLRLTENAARMRVDRALKKMRTTLAKRGIASTSGALSSLLANHVSGAAPDGLAMTITQNALVAKGGGIAWGFLSFTSKTKIIAGIAGALALAAITFGLTIRRPARLLPTSRAR